MKNRNKVLTNADKFGLSAAGCYEGEPLTSDLEYEKKTIKKTVKRG